MKQVSESVGAYYQHYPRIASLICASHKDTADAYECKLVEDRQYSDHQLIVGEVVAVH